MATFRVETRYAPKPGTDSVPVGWESGGCDLPSFTFSEWNTTDADIALKMAVEIIGASAREWQWWRITVANGDGDIVGEVRQGI